MRLHVGDLVKPKMKCAGLPGDTRCNTAIIINAWKSNVPDNWRSAEPDFEILCKCGSSWQHSGHLDPINENR